MYVLFCIKKTLETFWNQSFNLLNVWQELLKSLIQFHNVDKNCDFMIQFYTSCQETFISFYGKFIAAGCASERRRRTAWRSSGDLLLYFSFYKWVNTYRKCMFDWPAKTDLKQRALQNLNWLSVLLTGFREVVFSIQIQKQSFLEPTCLYKRFQPCYLVCDV